MRSIVLAAMLALLGSAAHAVPTAVDFATVSMSAPGVPRTVTDTVCASDGNDLVCDRGVYITSSSRVGIGTAAPRSTLHVSGSARVWGSGEIGYAPFLVGAQNSNKYLYMQMVSASSVGLLGTYDADSPGAVIPFVINTRVLISTDGWAVTPSSTLQVSGSLRLAHETSASLAVCDANRTGAIRYTGGDFSFCRNGSAWETLTSLAGGGGLGDRITSGTSAVVVNSASGIVSISQFGSVASYVHPSLGYVGPGVSTTGPISGTSGYFNGNLAVGAAVSTRAMAVSGSAIVYSDFGASVSKSYSVIDPGGIDLFLNGNPSSTIHGYVDFKSNPAEDYDVRQSYDGLNNRLNFTNNNADGIGFSGFPLLSLSRNGTAGFGTYSPSTSLHVTGSLRLAAESSSTLQACDVNRTGAIRYTGGDFSFCRNGSAWETLTSLAGGGGLGDRITSGTASGVVAMAGGTISFTTGGTSGTAYLDTVGRFIGAGVSTTGAISATSIYAGASLQLASPTAVTACTSTAAGTIRYNSPTTTLELCTGSGWQPMGVGIPAGTISAFASTTCPTGWSEYTAARGRFLRGIDNGAGNDPDGTRAPGASQADMLGSHKHHTAMGFDGGQFYGWLDGSNGPIAGSRVVTGANRLRASAPAEPNENVRLALTEVNESPVSGETRPKNVAVTYCQFNGTSNGWNNPLSGGSTVAAGSTGQLQYNTGNAFDASAGLTWTNASSLLGVAGTVSTTSITVGGLTLQQIMASATTAQGDRITSGTSAVVVNSATGIVSISQLGSVASYVHPSLGYVGPGVSTTGRVSSTGSYLAATDNQCLTLADEGLMFRNATTRKLQVCVIRY